MPETKQTTSSDLHQTELNLLNGESFRDSSMLRSQDVTKSEGTVKLSGKTMPFSAEQKPTIDGVTEISIDAPSLGGRQTFRVEETDSNSWNRRKVMLGLAAGSVSVAPAAQTAHACLENNPDSMYLAGGTQGPGLGQRWIYATLPNGTSEYFGGTEISPGWVVTAAHAIDSSQGVFTVDSVGNGLNFYTSPGQESAVAGVYVYPGYTSGFESPDIALIHLVTPLTTNSLSIAPTPSLNDAISCYGSGYSAQVGGQTFYDGNLREYQGPVAQFVEGNVSPQYFVSLDFDTEDGYTLAGHALGGDSGGGAFNSLGQYVGPVDASSGGVGPIGGSDVLVDSNPAVLNWQTSTMSSVPEPTSVGLIGVIALTVCLRNNWFRPQRKS